MAVQVRRCNNTYGRCLVVPPGDTLRTASCTAFRPQNKDVALLPALATDETVQSSGCGQERSADLRSSAMSRSVEWQLVSGQTGEGDTDRFSQKVGKELPLYAA
jgi:hypothetical protein